MNIGLVPPIEDLASVSDCNFFLLLSILEASIEVRVQVFDVALPNRGMSISMRCFRNHRCGRWYREPAQMRAMKLYLCSGWAGHLRG